MKKIFLFFFIVMGAVLQAQQLPHYSQYVLNDFVINPAIAGKDGAFEGKAVNRYQWEGITDAPRTYILSVNGPYKDKNMGLGGYVFTDITGPTRRAGISFTYAYHLKLNETMKLSMGLSAGLLQFAVDGSKIIMHDPGDVAITNGYLSALLPDFAFGTYFYSDKYYAGISVPQIYPGKLKFFDYATDSKLATHFYFTGGYRFDINDDFSIEPSIVGKLVTPAPAQLDLGARCIYQKKVWLGGAYRTNDAVSALIGYTYKEHLTIGYAYDFTTTNIKNYSSGTHELMLSIKFFKPKDKSVSATPIE